MGGATIRLVDSRTNRTQTLTCDTGVLQAHMGFFRDYLKTIKPGQEVELTLQSDPAVFMQLLSYCKLRPEDALAWRPAAGSYLPVMLAAHFLQIPSVVEVCFALLASSPQLLIEHAPAMLELDKELLQGVAKHIQEDSLEALGNASFESSCKDQRLRGVNFGSSHGSTTPQAMPPADRAASRTPTGMQQLLQPQDASPSSSSSSPAGAEQPQSRPATSSRSPSPPPRAPSSQQQASSTCNRASWMQTIHQLQEVLYKLKLGDTLRKRQAAVVCCSRCGSLYSLTAQPLLPCCAAAPAGSAAACFQVHQQDKSWKHAAYLQQQRHAGRTWRELYWETWALTTVLFCHCCEMFYPACESGNCRYHSQQPTDMLPDQQQPTCTHPCCGAAVLSNALRSRGCCSRAHMPLLPGTAVLTPRRAATAGGVQAIPSTSSISTAGRSRATPAAASVFGMAGPAAALPGLKGCSTPQEVGAACQMIKLYSSLIVPAAQATSPQATPAEPASSQQQPGPPLLVSMFAQPSAASEHVQSVQVMYQYRAGELQLQAQRDASSVRGTKQQVVGSSLPGSSASTPRSLLLGKLGVAAGGSVMAQVQAHVQQQDELQLRELREVLLRGRCLPPPIPVVPLL